jgi:putative FmdB family regulatory protein
MTIYAFRCSCGTEFDVQAPLGKAPKTPKCPSCGQPGTRVFTAPTVHFSGSGFHSNDYGRGTAGKPE